MKILASFALVGFSLVVLSGAASAGQGPSLGTVSTSVYNSVKLGDIKGLVVNGQVNGK